MRIRKNAQIFIDKNFFCRILCFDFTLFEDFFDKLNRKHFPIKKHRKTEIFINHAFRL